MRMSEWNALWHRESPEPTMLFQKRKTRAWCWSGNSDSSMYSACVCGRPGTYPTGPAVPPCNVPATCRFPISSPRLGANWGATTRSLACGVLLPAAHRSHLRRRYTGSPHGGRLSAMRKGHAVGLGRRTGQSPHEAATFLVLHHQTTMHDQRVCSVT